MSWTLLRGTLHQNRVSIFWFSFGLVLYSWMMTWFYPEIGGDQYAELVETMPVEVSRSSGAREVPFASLGGYFQMEYLGLMWMVIVASALISYSAKAFAGEIADGTMEFLLSQPVSRVRLASTRVAVMGGYSAALSAASFVPIMVFGPKYDIDLPWDTFWSLFSFGLLFMLAVGGFTLLLSAIFSGAGRPAAISAGVFVVLWIADLVSSFSEAAGFFDPVNLVGYWQPGKIINGDPVDAVAWWLYGGVALATVVAAVAVFRRRDVA